MNKIGLISHTNPIVDSKVKIFYDNLFYAFSNNGSLMDFQLENHMTIIDRAIFRTGKIKANSSTFYLLKSYFCNNDLFNIKNDFIAKQEPFRTTILQIKKLFGEKMGNFDEDKFEILINDLECKFSTAPNGDVASYVEQCFNRLMDLFENEEIELKECSAEIKYFSKIFSAEFIRGGFSAKDIVGADGILRKILESKIHTIGDENENNFYSDFPLPVEIEVHKHTKGYKEYVLSFLENRTFKEQFRGIITFLNKSKPGSFVIRIEGLELGPDDLPIELNECRIVDFNSIKSNYEKWDKLVLDDFKGFCTSPNSIILEVRSDLKSPQLGEEKAWEIAKDVQNLLSYVSGTRGTVNKNTYFFLFDSGGVIWTRKAELISKNHVSLLHKYSNEIQKVECSKTSFCVKFLELDKLFIRSFGDVTFSESVVYLWQYLEAIFANISGKKNAEIIVEKTTDILINNWEKDEEVRLFSCLSNLIFNDNDNILKISKSNVEKLKLGKAVAKGDWETKELFEISPYPFWRSLVKELDSLKKMGSSKKRKAFFKLALEELYEQRNFISHEGKYCDSTVRKIKRQLPILLTSFRKKVLFQISQNPEFTKLEEILQLFE